MSWINSAFQKRRTLKTYRVLPSPSTSSSSGSMLQTRPQAAEVEGWGIPSHKIGLMVQKTGEPVEVGSFFPLFAVLYESQVVVWVFFHEQYKERSIKPTKQHVEMLFGRVPFRSSTSPTCHMWKLRHKFWSNKQSLEFCTLPPTHSPKCNFDDP